MNAEEARVAQNDCLGERWDLWGPYLSERAWGTVREDYSATGEAWNYFPHDHARSRAYRWSEDGIGGISDFKQRLCLAFAFWNGLDPILKERFFGVAGPQGNHGEDVKELYWYVDNTPSHSFMRMVYRYPHTAFPYEELIGQNARRPRSKGEFELWDTPALESGFFDIEMEYAKNAMDDIFIRVTATNCGSSLTPLRILPTLWFRNTWSWGRNSPRPNLRMGSGGPSEVRIIEASHDLLGEYRLYCEGADEILFTENESNGERLWGVPGATPFVKDSINSYVVDGNKNAVNPACRGTKAAAIYKIDIPPRESRTIRLRLKRITKGEKSLHAFANFDDLFTKRAHEADEFYAALAPTCLTKEHCAIQRQALSGMLWSKQFYHYIVDQWLEGDPACPPPEERKHGRNSQWRHLYNERVMSMPDKWEFPWYASWDLAFHCIPLALVDPQFAKSQLDLIVREWYQHPNGQIPAYEWNFSDVNPPVIAWAAWRVYQIERKRTGKGDRAFLEAVFHKMLIAFTWWVNRKDSEGNNIFQGGFLGLDNIGVFDRNDAFPDGSRLEQSDGTSWMGMFCLNMLRIALELARENSVYENIATKFFEHFLSIAAAMNNLGGKGIGLWDEEDEFYYDVLHTPGGRYLRVRVRSLIGLMPMLAVETIEPALLDTLPKFKALLEWYLVNQPALCSLISRWQQPGVGERRLVALTRGHRMKCLLRRMLDPAEFLSDYGVRSVSKFHKEHPYVLTVRGEQKVISYEPAESRTEVFGGNSNWRGPVWMPINYLLIESLQKFHRYYGDDFQVECPTGSGQFTTLNGVANELSNRLIRIWLRDTNGRRPFAGASVKALNGEPDQDRYWFHEYFHGDTGAGLGASHQTGWTGLVAKLIQQQGEHGTLKKPDLFADL
jgi:Mannosyl oligosaccharide glucosidase.